MLISILVVISGAASIIDESIRNTSFTSSTIKPILLLLYSTTIIRVLLVYSNSENPNFSLKLTIGIIEPLKFQLLSPHQLS